MRLTFEKETFQRKSTSSEWKRTNGQSSIRSGRSELLRIAVIGAGAIGCLFGVRLHLAGQSVLLIHHTKNVAASNAKNGVRIREPSGKVVRANIKARTRLSTSDKPDLILVTVKAYDTENVALSLRATKLRNVPVLSLQNGLGNFETLDLHLGSDSIIAGTTSEG